MECNRWLNNSYNARRANNFVGGLFSLIFIHEWKSTVNRSKASTCPANLMSLLNSFSVPKYRVVIIADEFSIDFREMHRYSFYSLLLHLCGYLTQHCLENIKSYKASSAREIFLKPSLLQMFRVCRLKLIILFFFYFIFI